MNMTGDKWIDYKNVKQLFEFMERELDIYSYHGLDKDELKPLCDEVLKACSEYDKCYSKGQPPILEQLQGYF